MDEKPSQGGGPKDTTAYSGSKAPETRQHAEEKETVRDFRLIPGGKHGAPAEVGMSGMDREDVPSEGIDPGLTRYGDSPESA